MWILILGLVVFFAVHSVRMVAGGYREREMARAPGRWKGLYSLASAIGLGLIVWGWILYRPEAPQVYEPPAWGRHAAMALVWVAFVLLASFRLPAGYLKTALRHPFLAGIIAWSAAHLLANGDMASLLLFGSFLAYAVINRVAVMGRASDVPTKVQPRSDLIAVLAGTALYLIFVFWLHGLLFGVSPLG